MIFFVSLKYKLGSAHDVRIQYTYIHTVPSGLYLYAIWPDMCLVIYVYKGEGPGRGIIWGLVGRVQWFSYPKFSILFELLTSKTTALPLLRVKKKISSKFGVQGIKRSGILRWFQKCVELLRQKVPKDSFSEKRFFAKFSKSLKIQFFCKIFFPFAKLKTSAHFWNQREIPLLLIPCTPNFEEIFFQLL